MAKAARKSDIELLRIVAMVLIILGHDIMATGLPLAAGAAGGTASANLLFGRTFFNAGHWGAITFFLISGFFLKGGAVRWQAVGKILGLTIFYYLLMMAMGYLLPNVLPAPQSYGLWDVMSHSYWFITAYTLMMLVFPRLLEMVGEKRLPFLALVLGGGLFLYWGRGWLKGEAVVPEPVYLFLAPLFFMTLGHLLNRVKERVSPPMALAGLLVSLALLAGLNLYLSQEPPAFLLAASLINPLNTLLPVCLFLTFIKLPEFTSALVNWGASLMLAVYLIHANPYMSLLLWQQLFSKPELLASSTLPLRLLSEALLILLACALLECLRQKLMGGLKRIFRIKE